jgi:hypothetical protein
MMLEPFPLDEAITVWIDARQVAGPFQNQADFQRTLAETPYVPLAFELKKLGDNQKRL